MSTSSNIYAEKIFAEHPVALWTFDDKSDYISLITEAQRDMSLWTISGGARSTSGAFPETKPFAASISNKIIGSSSSGDFLSIDAISPNIIAANQLAQDMETFSIGTYVYAYSEFVNSIEIGYEYTDAGTSQIVRNLKSFNSNVSSSWTFVSGTFKVPTTTANIRAVVRIVYNNPNSVDTNDYTFVMNGLSFGQWSEEFNATSLGVLPSTISSTTLGTVSGVEAKAYGLQSAPGYYLSSSNRLLAKNTGVPMVYGASNVTSIYPNTSELPSLIVPGFGCFNEVGKYKDYTIEMWIRSVQNDNTSKKVFGPISSSDGLYVDGPFIRLLVNDYVGSYYIGDMFRPILLHIKITDNAISLLINGEICIAMDIDLDKISFPAQIVNGKSNDWLGFYSSEGIESIEIDAVAIYTYLVPEIVAKRRYVYGQAVEAPDITNTAYGQKTAFVDYSFSNYANNFLFPDSSRWSSGLLENISTSNEMLSAPNFNQPSILLKPAEGQTAESTKALWLSDLEQQQPPTGNNFISFSEYSGHIFVDTLNILSHDTKAIYGVFSVDGFNDSKRTLFQIKSKTNSDYFSCYVQGTSVYYAIKSGSSLSVLYSEDIFDASKIFAGVDFSVTSKTFGSSVASLFGNLGQLQVYIGSTESFSDQLDGKIYTFGICTARNFRKISSLLSVPELPGQQDIYDAGSQYFGNDANYWETVIDGGTVADLVTLNSMVNSANDHVASYTIKPRYFMGQFIIDIDTDSYWENYVPMSNFAKYVSDKNNVKSYSADFVQINIDYPESLNIDNGKIVTDSEYVKTYVSFQNLLKNGTSDFAQITNIEKLNVDRVVIPDDSWMNTAYEVVNGAIIYPPSGVDQSTIVMVIHLEMITTAISRNPIAIKRIELASVSIDGSKVNAIGTKFSYDLLPYSKNGAYSDYGDSGPFRIYKRSTPHLYLTRDSGIESISGNNKVSGISLLVNKELSDVYKMVSMQMLVKYSKVAFSQTPEVLFEIAYKGSTIFFYVVANDNSGKRGRIYAVDSRTGSTANGFVLYINGNMVREAVIDTKSWAFVGLDFPQGLDFDSVAGAIRLGNVATFNGISHYRSTSLEEREKKVYRKWAGVKEIENVSKPWSYWSGSFTWLGVLVISSRVAYSVNAQDIYKTYVGTNKIVVDDESTISLTGYQYRTFSDISWTTKTIDPV